MRVWMRKSDAQLGVLLERTFFVWYNEDDDCAFCIANPFGIYLGSIKRGRHFSLVHLKLRRRHASLAAIK